MALQLMGKMPMLLRSKEMVYLTLGFCAVWACHLGYLFVIDRQVRQLHRRLEARVPAAPDGA